MLECPSPSNNTWLSGPHASHSHHLPSFLTDCLPQAGLLVLVLICTSLFFFSSLLLIFLLCDRATGHEQASLCAFLSVCMCVCIALDDGVRVGPGIWVDAQGSCAQGF